MICLGCTLVCAAVCHPESIMKDLLVSASALSARLTASSETREGLVGSCIFWIIQ